MCPPWRRDMTTATSSLAPTPRTQRVTAQTKRGPRLANSEAGCDRWRPTSRHREAHLTAVRREAAACAPDSASDLGLPARAGLLEDVLRVVVNPARPALAPHPAGLDVAMHDEMHAVRRESRTARARWGRQCRPAPKHGPRGDGASSQRASLGASARAVAASLPGPTSEVAHRLRVRFTIHESWTDEAIPTARSRPPQTPITKGDTLSLSIGAALGARCGPVAVGGEVSENRPYVGYPRIRYWYTTARHFDGSAGWASSRSPEREDIVPSAHGC